MSGFEIAGLVLGSIPVVVSALKAYSDGISNMKKWRSYERELGSLVRKLNTEYVKLQNVLEELLVGTIHQTQVDEMIQNPFGPLWGDEKIQKKLRVRLWRSPQTFQDTIAEIQVAMDEIKTRLMLDPEGKVRWSEEATLKRILKQEKKKASFFLQRTTYDDLLTQIQDGVTSLETLVSGNVKLEPERRRRSQGRLYKLIRDLSKSTHEALRCAFRCEGLHSVSLRLAPLSAEVIPQDTDDDIYSSLSLQLIISSHSYQDQKAEYWEEIVLRPAIEQKMVSPTPLATYPKKGVRFLGTTTAICQPGSPTKLLKTNVASFPIEGHFLGDLTRDIDDLCQIIHKSAKRKIEACYGRITDSISLKKYGLYSVYGAQYFAEHDWKMVPLTDIIKNSEGKFPPLMYADKLRLAWIIASSVVQLHNTPWVPNTLRHSDVFFIQRPNKPLLQDVFVLKEFPNKISPDMADFHAVAAVQNKTLIALGILLVELILGQTMDVIRGHDDSFNPLADYEQAMKLLSKVWLEGSPNYESAVRRCLRCESHRQSRSLDDEGFRQDVFGGIVALLEEDMNMSV